MFLKSTTKHNNIIHISIRNNLNTIRRLVAKQIRRLGVNYAFARRYSESESTSPPSSKFIAPDDVLDSKDQLDGILQLSLSERLS